MLELLGEFFGVFRDEIELIEGFLLSTDIFVPSNASNWINFTPGVRLGTYYYLVPLATR